MSVANLDWTHFAAELAGPRFARFHAELTGFNAVNLQPLLPTGSWREELAAMNQIGRAGARSPADIPHDADGFIVWFERLRETGPGQGDPLFPWLAAHASRDQM